MKSSIITEAPAEDASLRPVHPGAVLFEYFLRPLGMSQYRLARGISVPPRRVNEIVHETRAVTADTALRRGRFFGTTPQFWLNLQMRYDLDVSEDRLGDRLETEVVPLDYAAASPGSAQTSG